MSCTLNIAILRYIINFTVEDTNFKENIKSYNVVGVIPQCKATNGGKMHLPQNLFTVCSVGDYNLSNHKGRACGHHFTSSKMQLKYKYSLGDVCHSSTMIIQYVDCILIIILVLL